MSEKQPPQQSNEESQAAPKSGRRAFLGAASTLVASSAALAGAAPAEAAPGDAEAFVERVSSGLQELNSSLQNRELRKRALFVRVQAAKNQFDKPLAKLPNNGDERRYLNKIGSDTRGLPHDQRGEVDPSAWQAAERAYSSRSFADFEKIPLGGTRKFVNPIGTLAASLEGANVTQVPIPAAPTLAGPERAAEAVEQYWQAVLRDVPFAQLTSHPLAQEAAQELDKLPGYAGPRLNGKVAPEVLFRGTANYVDPADRSGAKAKVVVPPGTLDGPYLPQFVFRDAPYGTQSIPAAHRVPLAGQEFQTDYDEWLAIQDGEAPTRSIQFDPQLRHLTTIRDLAEHTHGGSPLFWGAILQLSAGRGGTATRPAGIGARLSATNPYLTSKTQASSNGTFGVGYLQALLTVGVSRAIRAAYWAKWYVHRSVRPEAYGGLVHQRVEKGVSSYPIHEQLLTSQALARSASKFGTHLLPQAYPEGAPLHGSYPAGSAVIAGVSATLTKAFFDESFVIPDAVQVDPNDPTKLIPYTDKPLTVGGELNKLALISTFGRVLAGIHWRSDAAAALVLGEQIAISILEDERLTFVEPFAGFTFTKFDGTKVTI